MADTASNMLLWRAEMESMKFSDGEDLNVFLSKAERLQRLLKDTDAPVGDGELILRIFKGMPKRWDGYLSSIRGSQSYRDGENSYKRIKEDLICEWRTQESLKQQEPAKMAMVGARQDRPQFSKGRFQGECRNCKKKGHKQEDCWAKGGGKEGKGPRQNRDQRFSKLTEHYSLNAGRPGSSDGKEWILDSGASDHMTGRLDVLYNTKAVHGETVELADNSIKTIIQKGEIHLKCKQGNGTDTKLTLTDVLYVPGLGKNLLSIPAIQRKQGAEVVFQGDNALIKLQGKVIAICHKSERELYILDGEQWSSEKASASAHSSSRETGTASISKWHRRMGHLNFGQLSLLPKMADGITFSDQAVGEGKCETCIVSKATRAVLTGSSNSKDDKLPGEYYSTDICSVSIGDGNKGYFVTYDDHSSDATLVFSLSSKAEQAECFKKVWAFSFSQTGRRMKGVLLDNAGENLSDEMKTFCAEKGVEIITTTAYTPEQNGKAERKNRTLVEMVRSMLADSGLGQQYWQEALKMATYLRNRSPTKANGGAMTPIEMFTGSKPNLRFVKPFGTIGYIYINAHRRGKLDSKAEKGRLVGMGPKGYKMLSSSGKIIDTVHVTFAEKGLLPKAEDVDIDSEGESEGEAEKAGPKKIKDAIHPAGRKEEEKIDRRDDEKNSEAQTEVAIQAQKEDAIAKNANEKNETREKAQNSKFEQERIKAMAESILTKMQEKEKAKPGCSMQDVSEKAEKDINGDVGPENIVEGKRMRKQANIANTINLRKLTAPQTISEAKAREDWNEWKAAMEAEMESLKINKTWGSPIARPSERNVVSCKWVFSLKINAMGAIDKYKARLVARGFTQEEGVDYETTFAPVVKYTTLRVLLAIALAKGLRVTQMDIVTAYLYADLDCEILMEQPEEFQEGEGVLPLMKGLYGLKQAGMLWHGKILTSLLKAGFTQNTYEPGLYTLIRGKVEVYLIMYVDDILVATNSEEERKRVEKSLQDEYKVKLLGEFESVLGTHVKIDVEQGIVTMSKKHYLETKACEFGQENAKEETTPMVYGLTLEKATQKPDKNYPYRAMIGGLLYAANTSRPDIAFAVGYLARFSDCHEEKHWQAGMRILRYLNHTSDLIITYRRGQGTTFNITAYADASFAMDTVDYKSTSGYAIYLNGNLISWRSTKQKSTALSTAEAEIAAATECVKEMLWLRDVVSSFDVQVTKEMILHEDNQACIAISEAETITARTKHIGVKTAFLREQVKLGNLKMVFCETKQMTADILTKALPEPQHEKLVAKLGLAKMGES